MKSRDKKAIENIAANLQLLVRKSTAHMDKKLDRILELLEGRE